MPDYNPIEAQINSLQSDVSQLIDTVVEVQDTQDVAIGKLQRLQRWLLVVGIIAIVVFGFLAVRAATQAAEIRDNSRHIEDIQEKTSTEAFCPLYDLFLDSYDPDGTQAKEDPKAYEEAFATIEKGAKALGCDHTIRGPN